MLAAVGTVRAFGAAHAWAHAVSQRVTRGRRYGRRSAHNRFLRAWPWHAVVSYFFWKIVRCRFLMARVSSCPQLTVSYAFSFASKSSLSNCSAKL
eukprot:375200-Prymnesium_polylepis.1